MIDTRKSVLQKTGAKAESNTLVTLKLTADELALLTSLASDQLFRREFIDPKMPGYKGNLEETKAGKALVARFKSILDPGSAKRNQSAQAAGASVQP